MFIDPAEIPNGAHDWPPLWVMIIGVVIIFIVMRYGKDGDRS